MTETLGENAGFLALSATRYGPVRVKDATTPPSTADDGASGGTASCSRLRSGCATAVSAASESVELSLRPARAADAPLMAPSCAVTLKLVASTIDRTTPDDETTMASDHVGQSVGSSDSVTVAVARGAPLPLSMSWQVNGPTAGPLRNAGRSVTTDERPARRSGVGGSAAAAQTTGVLAAGSFCTATAPGSCANPQASVALTLAGGHRLSAKPYVTLGKESESDAASTTVAAALPPLRVKDIAIGNRFDCDCEGVELCVGLCEGVPVALVLCVCEGVAAGDAVSVPVTDVV